MGELAKIDHPESDAGRMDSISGREKIFLFRLHSPSLTFIDLH
jgi:hypothetical protein